MKGPVVYCLEEDDNGEELQMIHLAGKKNIHEEFVPDLLGGIVRITMTAEEEYGPADDGLYYDCSQVKRRERKLTFIPYYAWANRNEGEMTVWVND